MSEFARIEKYFRPLATHPGSLNLKDDAAILKISEGNELVITTDAMTQGVHFLGTESPGDIARKLLRANLSDLAAKSACPLAYLLTVMLPKSTPDEWVEKFAEGLKKDQELFGISLMGGDSITTKGEPSFSITAFGKVPQGKAILRSGAKPEDLIMVTGTIGDAAGGLMLFQEPEINLSPEHSKHLKSRYTLPEPRLAVGTALQGIASSMMDISDGFVQDLEHLCGSSNCGAIIDWQDIPISPAAYALLAARPQREQNIICGGDDYELLFTISPENYEKLDEISEKTKVTFTTIGHMIAEKGVHIQKDGADLVIQYKGYEHG